MVRGIPALFLCVWAVFSHFPSTHVVADDSCDPIKVNPFDPTASDYFGWSVAVEGDVIVAGAYQEDPGGISNAGSAYVFQGEEKSFLQVAKLTASDAEATDYFGNSVSISGDAILVGAYFENPNGFVEGGSAYVFRFDGVFWTQEAKLIASDAGTGDYFGVSTSLSGAVAVMGAYKEDANGIADAGSAYVFRFDGDSWIQEAKLVASDAATTDNFGVSVSVDGDVIVVGANFEDPDGLSAAGSAYVFRFDGAQWVEVSKLSASDGEASDNFGIAVAVSGDRALIGASQDDVNGLSNAGSVYFFDYDGSVWLETAKFSAGVPDASANFGFSVALDGDQAVVGSYLDDTTYSDEGTAYLYDFDGVQWRQRARLDPFDGESLSYFGRGVALDGGRVVVGADSEDAGSVFNAGSVYVFDALSADCNGNGVVDSCDLADDVSQDCTGNGVPDECDIADGSANDCNGNVVPDECDLAEGGSTECNGNGLPDECDIASGSSEDCNLNALPDECDLASGASTDLDQDGLPDDCEDCNGNLIPDNFDLANGASQDCNSNLLPDECDVANTTSLDCNSNLVPDECDFANGFGDCQANAIPDECEVDASYTHESGLLVPEGADDDDLIGEDVALFRDVAVVGAKYEDPDGVDDAGSVYVFRFDGARWTQETKLNASVLQEDGCFGEGVAVGQDLIVVGGSDDEAPVVYVFRWNGFSWFEETQLSSSSDQSSSTFGISIALHDEVLVVGDTQADAFDVTDSGAAFVFRNTGSGWVEENMLASSDPDEDDQFGGSVAVNDDLIVVGAYDDDVDDLTHAGAAYVFRFDGTRWIEESRLTAADAGSYESFGWSVAADDDLIVVGDTGADSGDISGGGAYVFRFRDERWIQEGRLTASAPETSALLGESVAVVGSLVVAGAPEADADSVLDAGAVYLFRYDGVRWSQTNKLVSSSPDTGLDFGDSVATDGNTVLIGSPEETTISNSDIGSAAVYVVTAADCNDNEIPDACEIEDGSALDSDNDGVLDQCETDFEDCNDNGVPDELDLSFEVSRDCNRNQTPDECDLAGGTSADCQGNGIPDDCDILDIVPHQTAKLMA